jgi:hypothetical protein
MSEEGEWLLNKKVSVLSVSKSASAQTGFHMREYEMVLDGNIEMVGIQFILKFSGVHHYLHGVFVSMSLFGICRSVVES